PEQDDGGEYVGGDEKELWVRSFGVPDRLELSKTFQSRLRSRLNGLLSVNTDSETQDQVRKNLQMLNPEESGDVIRKPKFFVPFNIRDYTDFYCSIYHA